MSWKLFDNLPPERLDDVRSHLEERKFGRGDFIIHAGELADGVFFIDYGRVAITGSTPEGDQTTLAILGPGDHFGELALVRSDQRRTASAIALEARTRLKWLSSRRWAELRHHREVDEIADRFLTDYITRLGDQLTEALFVPAETRVVRRVIDLCGKYRPTAQGAYEMKLTMKELADLAGTSRATTSTVLNQIKQGDHPHGGGFPSGTNPIQLATGRIVVQNLDALIALEASMRQSKRDI